MKKTALAFALLLALPVWAQDASVPSPEKLELAQRVIDAPGNAFALIPDRLRSLAPPAYATERDKYAAAMDTALATQQPEIKRLENALVESYARLYTLEELKALVAYEESPEGKSVRAKTRLAQAQRQQDVELTEAETTARTNNLAILQKSMERRQARNDAFAGVERVTIAIMLQASVEYCRTASQCPAFVKDLSKIAP